MDVHIIIKSKCLNKIQHSPDTSIGHKTHFKLFIFLEWDIYFTITRSVVPSKQTQIKTIWVGVITDYIDLLL